VTPFMRALDEFPRHIYHGAALSSDLAPWMPAVCRRLSVFFSVDMNEQVLLLMDGCISTV
jgi:hypothetical protein